MWWKRDCHQSPSGRQLDQRAVQEDNKDSNDAKRINREKLTRDRYSVTLEALTISLALSMVISVTILKRALYFRGFEEQHEELCQERDWL